MIKGNKGEWSELYVLLRLLSHGKIYAADDNLKKIEGVYFPILKVIREEIKKSKIEYRVKAEEIEIYLNDEKMKSVNRERLANEAKYLYEQIIGGSSRSFEIEKTEEFMKNIDCYRLSAPSSDKTDITMQIHDIHTGFEPVCGFSIKSELGSAPTLLNASGATNFVYEVEGITDEQMEQINQLNTPIGKIRERMSQISALGLLKFVGARNPTFTTNLMMIDSRMEELMGEFLLCHYRDNISSCEEIVQKLEEKNPLQFPKSGFYKFKFKKFLCSVALGMMPSKEWDGYDEVNGGYIIVVSDGDVLAYHIYNRDYFEGYLLKNTKLERGSTSRHGFAILYKEDGRMFINLNLQVRFK